MTSAIGSTIESISCLKVYSGSGRAVEAAAAFGAAGFAAAGFAVVGFAAAGLEAEVAGCCAMTTLPTKSETVTRKTQ